MDIPPLKRSIVGLLGHLTFSMARETTYSSAALQPSESFRQPWMQKFPTTALALAAECHERPAWGGKNERP
jgi:hypothetical protein